MKRRTVENALRWMLAAWTLGASSFVAPTVSHAHPDGGCSHQHDAADYIPGGLSQSFTPQARQSGYASLAYLSAADFHHHGCLFLLGAVKHLPTPSEPVSPHGHSPYVWETTLVVSSAAGSRACSSGVAGDSFQLVSLADVSVECARRSGQYEVPVLGVAPSAPLCDRARHERSGVQLS